MRPATLTAWFLLAATFVPQAEAGSSPGEPDLFSSRVRPILARHCFKCHGPDEKARKAGLRLDVREGALRTLASGARAVVPGKPDESELVSRILSGDAEEVMPPPHAKLPLSPVDQETLKRWVAGGAGYTTHWAFIAPRQAPPPALRDKDWPRSAIDAFVLARLEAEGLRPSPRAGPATLIRRLSLDLVGLPPTPEEVDAFVGDPSPDAYERLVDRLLASPHYGERWARRWLDMARYSDTNGYEKDRPRSIWPYRDWVIRSLNADLPFDRFTVDQLAGDMLSEDTLEAKIATGFHRNTMLNEEGGIDPLEFRFHAVTDRVATTATVWLGMTFGCAQCHTHKFDPLTHRDYYRFMAFLDNADEPEVAVPSPGLARRRRELEAKIAALVADLTNRFPVDDASAGDARSVAERRKDRLEKSYHEWLGRESAAAVRWTRLRPLSASSNLPKLTVEEDGSIFVSGDQSKRDLYTLEYPTDIRGITALRLEVLPDSRLPKGGPGRVYYEGPSGDFFLSEFGVAADGGPQALKAASHSFAGNPPAGAAAAIDGDPQTGWTINGGQGREHSAVFTLARPLDRAGKLRIHLLFERYHAAGLGRFRISATTDPRPLSARSTPFDIEPLLLVPEGQRTREQDDRLLRCFLAVAPELARERESIDGLRKALPADPTTLVMDERPPSNPRTTFVHNRGEYLQPTERVDAAIPAFLPPLPGDLSRDRLGLARWLFRPENPLTARVTMNRQWAAFFGRGLVRTSEDFGYQGEPPSHPELLDWLAVEFAKRAWSLKAMHKLIVMSATYQQSSRVAPALLEKDPENRLLARGPRVRVDAEVIRDQALRVSGLLCEKVGGPSVFPPQPPGVTTDGAYGRLDWKVSEGEDRYRRGMYTFSKRTAPYPMFTTFDGPSGEVCVARREVSNTPLQALTLLNDPAFRDVTQALGRNTASAPGSVEDRAERLFRRCLARTPSPDELAALVRFFQAQKARFSRKELDAETIAGPGHGDASERAAWAVLARAILNLDEAITKG